MNARGELRRWRGHVLEHELEKQVPRTVRALRSRHGQFPDSLPVAGFTDERKVALVQDVGYLHLAYYVSSDLDGKYNGGF